MLFQGVREVVFAFSPDMRTGDQEVDQAVELVSDLRPAGSSVGFFGRERDTKATSVAIKLLQDHGKNLTYEQTVETLQKLDENQSIRRRFWVQLLVTVVVLAIALSAILRWFTVSEDLKKVAYGFVGTVVGYWLK
jgi:hypothetical protein